MSEKRKLDADTAELFASIERGLAEVAIGKGRVTTPEQILAREARAKVGVSQLEFSKLLGVSIRTLQDWEQGRHEPSGAAKTLLRIAAQSPEAVRMVVAA